MTGRTPSSDVQQAALAYAARGWWVFPCRPGSKEPATARGFKDATTDPERIRELFDQPDYNIGIATGPSGLVVFDVDGEQGQRSLAALRAEGVIPETLTHRTRTGGQHLPFSAPSGVRIKCSQSKLAPGIDVRAEGGYIVAPPSWVAADTKGPAGRYEVELDFPVAPLPDWLVNRLVESVRNATNPTQAGEQPARRQGSDNFPQTPENIARIVAGLAARTDADGWHHEDKWFLTLLDVRSLRDAAGWQDGFAWELFDSWSRRVGGNYDKQKNRARWDHDDPPAATPRTFASLLRDSKPPAFLAPAKRFKLYTVRELAGLPPQRYRVGKIFPETGLAAIFGPSGVGKTFWLTDLGLRIALGLDWFGHSTNSCPVIHVVLEGAGGISKRIKAWEIHNNRQAPDHYRVVIDQLSLFHDGDIEAFADLLQLQGLGSGLIFIDTLNRAASEADENSSRDMGRILERSMELQKITKSLVALVHHPGKDVTKGLRGHSSLNAALDVAIELSKTTQGREWVATKNKDGECGAAMPFRLERVVVGQDPNGQPETSCVVAEDINRVIAQVSAKPKGSNQTIALREVELLIVQSPHGSKIRLEDAVVATAAAIPADPRHRTQRAREALKGLVAADLLHCDGEWLSPT